MKLSQSLFPALLFSLILISSGSASAGDSAAQDDNDTAQEQPAVLPEFSMADVKALKLRGGNYWMGYFGYQIDLEKAEMTATWNRFDCSMKRASGEAKLTLSDIQNIKAAVEGLRYEMLSPDDECHLMADGDESSLTLVHTGDVKTVPAMYPMKSWYSACQGKPLSDEAYKAVEDVIFKILPQPTDAAQYFEVDPDNACPI